jgi:hypothetical protein
MEKSMLRKRGSVDLKIRLVERFGKLYQHADNTEEPFMHRIDFCKNPPSNPIKP